MVQKPKEATIRAQLLVRYPRTVASSRHRFYDMEALLAARGIKCASHTLVRSVDSGGMVPRSLRTLAAAYAGRVAAVWRKPRPDVLVVQYEALPFVPAAFELALLDRSIPFVLDYDDAWFHHYDMNPSSLIRWTVGSKIEQLVRHAAAVSVGSEYLYEFASRFSPRVFRVPTSVDLESYPVAPVARTQGTGFTVGWIGSRTTAPFLNLIAPALNQFLDETPGARFVAIGAGDVPLDIAHLVRLPWEESREATGIAEFDVGVMPMPDTPFTRGKCAYKLLQYMACWKPTVASDVGENSRVVVNGESGYLTTSIPEWLAALRRVRDAPDRGQRMGVVGRAIVEQRYTRSVAANAMAATIRAAVACPSISHA